MIHQIAKTYISNVLEIDGLAERKDINTEIIFFTGFLNLLFHFIIDRSRQM